MELFCYHLPQKTLLQLFGVIRLEIEPPVFLQPIVVTSIRFFKQQVLASTSFSQPARGIFEIQPHHGPGETHDSSATDRPECELHYVKKKIILSSA